MVAKKYRGLIKVSKKKNYPLLFLLVIIGFGIGTQGAIFLRREAALSIDEKKLGVWFSPKGGCTDCLVQAIGKAKKELYIYIYSFTSGPIADALVAAKKRGVKIFIIADSRQSKGRGSKIADLHGVVDSIYLDKQAGVAHNKWMVIDQALVFTGSFNYSKNAEENNRENLVYAECPDLAKKFYANWVMNRDSRGVIPFGDLNG